MKAEKPDAPYFVYIVECADGTYYTGSTNDVEKRLKAHNAGKTGAKYTRSRLPVRVIYTETLANRSEAQKRETEIKRMDRAAKRVLMRTND